MPEYVYYNNNPNNVEELDCVCRAISLALRLDYAVVQRLLVASAELKNCDTLCVCCYRYLLEELFNLPCRYCDYSETVNEVAQKYPNNVLLIRIDGHLTCALYGAVFDIWNCADKLVDRYWIAS